jgi:hypothetical protein
MGDLGQFYHIMGSESHWGSEDPKRHRAYEVAVEKTIRFQNRTSTLFESFISPIAVRGDTPEEIARTLRCEPSEAPAAVAARLGSWTSGSVNSFTRAIT